MAATARHQLWHQPRFCYVGPERRCEEGELAAHVATHREVDVLAEAQRQWQDFPGKSTVGRVCCRGRHWTEQRAAKEAGRCRRRRLAVAK